MVRIEKVLRSHFCNSDDCEKQLFKGEERVNFESNNYCIVCGYMKMKDKMVELNILMGDLKSRYGKLLVLERLKR